MERADITVFASLGGILTRDYASRFDPLFRWARNPPAVLSIAMVAAVFCGLYLHPRALILVAGLAAVLVEGTAWPWLSVRGLGGTLEFGRGRIREGELGESDARRRPPDRPRPAVRRGLPPDGTGR